MTISILGCFLDDRPSQRSAEQAAKSIAPGMSMLDVVKTTERIGEKHIWALTFDRCGDQSLTYVVQHAVPAGGYVIRTHQYSRGRTTLVSSRAVAAYADLGREMQQEPLASCKEVDIGFGQWGVPVIRDASGRVAEVRQLRFVD